MQIEYCCEHRGAFATAHQFAVLSALLACSSIASRLFAYVYHMALLKALCGSINSPWRILSTHVDRPRGRATPSTSSWFHISARKAYDVCRGPLKARCARIPLLVGFNFLTTIPLSRGSRICPRRKLLYVIVYDLSVSKVSRQLPFPNLIGTNILLRLS
ncbi:hypothetical protein EV361DRAFT_527102 [Lentinula raphanica]|nr:hypothetical protein EV361DRAFT_527102 [Lentinula raphanica]